MCSDLFTSGCTTPTQLTADANALTAENAADGLDQQLYVGEYDWDNQDPQDADVTLNTFMDTVEAYPVIVGSSPWDMLPIINGVPECHADGYSFYYPAQATNCPDTPTQATQAAALARWAEDAQIMAAK
jgi:hypothetical protein